MDTLEGVTGNSEYGTETLRIISKADRFNRWMYETIRPFCRGRIIEIGSGIGNISQYFLEDGSDITLSDYENSYFPILKKKFAGYTNLRGIHLVDISVQDVAERYPDLTGAFDTVFALNVVEHIEEHRQAMLNAHRMLRAGGKVVILVPAFQELYNSFDEQLGHYRRYTGKSLRNLLEETGFEVVYARYFNFIAILGWFISGRVLKKRVIPEGQMKLYNVLVPLWRMVDKLTGRFAGISLIQVGKKTD